MNSLHCMSLGAYIISASHVIKDGSDYNSFGWLFLGIICALLSGVIK